MEWGLHLKLIISCLALVGFCGGPPGVLGLATDVSETLPYDHSSAAEDLGDTKSHVPSPNHCAETKRAAYQQNGKAKEDSDVIEESKTVESSSVKEKSTSKDSDAKLSKIKSAKDKHEEFTASEDVRRGLQKIYVVFKTKKST